ncbi:translation initiation factor IF-2-like isoform X1 [Catharus ustulatus]|uniref:translation initiation factor IF-2-like isoform X1 n=1 Tax=Catharus ustulatus TaxID=91951 RepID=UPI001408A908|nr:translation initiation factor IF-2-like isoform X1 [Catharus ustulatus]XP_032922718.1 translation initiation factor IF-2-like isoform X1 [Catharus ustulatus]XP_032922720.1 translation initiation factor IF-2-like isoform X1 [Catharus ustulatus]XP_032922721.1 translation initiation factor IF-2-like isoform X1 [Catharus ustulatus]XP_032922722.1 translation initiation factor IF-2-like isoform X1 [Catharus ustulatus]XP_032922723.1 translation initiation factor IF-2-like isoform X1 [Catharus ustu
MAGISQMVKLFYCTPGMDSHTWISDRSPRQISGSQPPPFTEPVPRCRGPAARGCGQASCSAYRFRSRPVCAVKFITKVWAQNGQGPGFSSGRAIFEVPGEHRESWCNWALETRAVAGNRTVINCCGPEGRLCSVTMYEVLFCFSKRQKPPSDAAAVPAFKYFGDVLASIPERALGKHQEITEPFRLEKSSDITESKLCPSPPCPQPRALSPGQLQGPQTSPGSPFQCPASLFMWEFLPNSPGPAPIPLLDQSLTLLNFGVVTTSSIPFFRAVTASTRWTRGTRRASPGHRLTATPRAIRASPSTPRSPTAPPRSRAACSAPKPAGLPPPRPPATPPAASPGPCTALPAAWPPAPELPSLGFPLSFDI